MGYSTLSLHLCRISLTFAAVVGKAIPPVSSNITYQRNRFARRKLTQQIDEFGLPLVEDKPPFAPFGVKGWDKTSAWRRVGGLVLGTTRFCHRPIDSGGDMCDTSTLGLSPSSPL